MNPALIDIQDSLKEFIDLVNSNITIDQALSLASGNWQYFGVGKKDLTDIAQETIDLIELRGSDDISENQDLINSYAERIKYINNGISSISQIADDAAKFQYIYYIIQTFIITNITLNKAISSVLNSENTAELSKQMGRARKRLNAVQSTLDKVELDIKPISDKVAQIKQAYEIATQLPATLSSLDEAQNAVKAAHAESRQQAEDTLAQASSKAEDILKEAAKTNDQTLKYHGEAENIKKELSKLQSQAEVILTKSNEALRQSIGAGLAAAFKDRSKKLSDQATYWVAGLFSALMIGGAISYQRFNAILALINNPDAQTSSIVINLLMTLTATGGAVWFAWLSTKQIGYNFRLSEDYAFKASISEAYEGYRREAEKLDTDEQEIQRMLLEITLKRFDELPIRLIEKEIPGSPIFLGMRRGKNNTQSTAATGDST